MATHSAESHEQRSIRWPKYWSFCFSIRPSNEYSGLISLGFIGLISSVSKGLSGVFSNITVQKASNLWHSVFLIVQLSHPYMTTGKTIVLTNQAFVSKVMSLLFNMLCRLVIAFLPRSMSFNFMAAVTICSGF